MHGTQVESVFVGVCGYVEELRARRIPTAQQPRAYDALRLAQMTSTGPVQILSQLFARSTSKTDYPQRSCVSRATRDTGGTVTMTGSGPDAGSDFVIEPTHWCRWTDRLVLMSEPTMSPRGHVLTSVIAGRHHRGLGKVDVRNVPITNIAPLQALSARRYMQKVRTVNRSPCSISSVRRHSHGRAGGVDCGSRRGPEGRLG